MVSLYSEQKSELEKQLGILLKQHDASTSQWAGASDSQRVRFEAEANVCADKIAKIRIEINKLSEIEAAEKQIKLFDSQFTESLKKISLNLISANSSISKLTNQTYWLYRLQLVLLILLGFIAYFLVLNSGVSIVRSRESEISLRIVNIFDFDEHEESELSGHDFISGAYTSGNDKKLALRFRLLGDDGQLGYPGFSFPISVPAKIDAISTRVLITEQHALLDNIFCALRITFSDDKHYDLERVRLIPGVFKKIVWFFPGELITEQNDVVRMRVVFSSTGLVQDNVEIQATIDDIIMYELR